MSFNVNIGAGKTDVNELKLYFILYHSTLNVLLFYLWIKMLITYQ